MTNSRHKTATKRKAKSPQSRIPESFQLTQSARRGDAFVPRLVLKGECLKQWDFAQVRR